MSAPANNLSFLLKQKIDQQIPLLAAQRNDEQCNLPGGAVLFVACMFSSIKNLGTEMSLLFKKLKLIFPLSGFSDDA